MSGVTGGSCDLWLGYADRGARRDLARALRLVSPGASLSFEGSAQELRDAFLDEEPGTVGAIVGLSQSGVSDVNLAAALVADGRACQVVLVTRGASGSLRSRAARAGISRVVDLADAPRPPSEGRGAGVGRSATADAPSAREPPTAGPSAAAVAARPSAADVATRPSVVGATGTRAPIIAFASGRGGVGKTTIAASCAARAASWGMDVAVADLDLSCGNLFAYFGASHGSDLAGLAEGGLTPERMGRAGVGLSHGVTLWGPCDRPECAEVFAPHAKVLLEYLCSRFDLVIVDCSTTFTDAVAHAAQAADRLVLVSSREPGALASLARTSGLAARLGVERTRMVRVENAADPRVAPAPIASGAEAGLCGARLFRVADGGDDARDLLAEGEVRALACDECEFGDSVGSFLAQVLSDLGRLPDSDAALRDLDSKAGKRRFSLFGHRKGA